MANIERCKGIDTGFGYLVGSGYYGKTRELDDIVQQAANLLRKTFDTDIQMRFNSDQQSGGAFVKDDRSSSEIGITAGLANRELYEMGWENIVELSRDEFNRFQPDFIKISTCLSKDFLTDPSDFILIDKEYRDFETLDQAIKWILEGTNKKLWEYIGCLRKQQQLNM